MEGEGIILNWHPPDVDQYFMAVGAAGVGVGFLLLGFFQHSVLACSVGVVSLLLGIACCIKTRTRIEPRLRVVSREGYLFGRFRLWGKHRPFSDFVAVRYRRVESPDDRTIFIGLRRRQGRVLEVRYYNAAPGSPGAQARDEARWLSNLLGLPLDER